MPRSSYRPSYRRKRRPRQCWSPAAPNRPLNTSHGLIDLQRASAQSVISHKSTKQHTLALLPPFNALPRERPIRRSIPVKRGMRVSQPTQPAQSNDDKKRKIAYASTQHGRGMERATLRRKRLHPRTVCPHPSLAPMLKIVPAAAICPIR